MSSRPVAYILHVASKDNHSALLCVTHSLDREGKFVAADFAEIASTFSAQGFNVPPGRFFTFQEELRVLARASDVVPPDTQDIRVWITRKMKEAYGNDVEVSIEQIKDKSAG